VDVSGEPQIADHRAKLRLRPFDRSAAPDVPAAPADDSGLASLPSPAVRTEEMAALKLALAKREWLLETLERQRDLAPAAVAVERRSRLSSQEFLDRYYAPARPVILVEEMRDWPALARWSPAYLKAKVGSTMIDYQGGRAADPRFEMDKDAHRRQAPFDIFIDAILKRGAGNDSYITAYNSDRNREALAPLGEDMGFLDRFLTRDRPSPTGMMWIGPAGTLTALHHDLTNNLIAQLVGRKRIQLLPASEVGKLYNHHHVFSPILDIEDPRRPANSFPRLAEARAYEVVLEPGEILFVPLAWWHQVKALDFSVTATFTNFLWPNDGYATYPSG